MSLYLSALTVAYLTRSSQEQIVLVLTPQQEQKAAGSKSKMPLPKSPLHISWIALLFCAFFLSFLVSISLPYIRTMDIVRVHSPNSPFQGAQGVVLVEARLGIWSVCEYGSDGERVCPKPGHGYTILFGVINKSGSIATTIIGSSWTRGLAIHPVACAITFIALVLSFTQHILVTLATSFLAALLTLIAFAVDIALYAFVHHQLDDLNSEVFNIITGPGFWLTFVALLFLLMSGGAIFLGLRKDRMENSYPSYPMSSSAKTGFLSKLQN